MNVSTETLESLYTEFVQFIQATSNEQFQTFATSTFLENQENYKQGVSKEARGNLGTQFWKPADIGTGKIQQWVSEAIKTKEFNNLVDWRKKDDFAKRPKSRTLETTLFNFYKSKMQDSEAFFQFISEGLSYQFIAYLFFIKDSNRFLPISQERFDQIFVKIGLPDFKTRNNSSWENYWQYCEIIKQVRDFLRTKDHKSTLLDAHSFLWILGNQMEEGKPRDSNALVLNKQKPEPAVEQPPKPILKSVSGLSSLEWTEILQNDKITTEIDLDILTTLYSFQGHKTYASQIAIFLNTNHSHLNLEIGRYAKRIAAYYDINFIARSTREFKYWDLFFNGWDEGTKFVWQLRSEIVEALEATGLTSEEKLPEELPLDTTEELFEGLKRTITVNSYERNAKAREICVDHYKAICAVCSFDFEKTYGEIGKGFIHVHHLTPVSSVGKSYQVDPIKDLIPVCPNCHAMLHKQEPPLAIQDLKSKMSN